ncbi:MAG: hypothetical protein RJB47_1559, partial [Pseudomonadota bacterium]
LNEEDAEFLTQRLSTVFHEVMQP